MVMAIHWYTNGDNTLFRVLVRQKISSSFYCPQNKYKITIFHYHSLGSLISFQMNSETMNPLNVLYDSLARKSDQYEASISIGQHKKECRPTSMPTARLKTTVPLFECFKILFTPDCENE
jgi:hypothetical protein